LQARNNLEFTSQSQ